MKIPPINFGSFWLAVYEKLCKIYTSIYQKEYILTLWAPLVRGLGAIAYTRIAITFLVTHTHFLCSYLSSHNFQCEVKSITDFNIKLST